MRILMVARPARGGMRQHLLALAEGLRSRGVEVEVAGPAAEPLLQELAARGCPIWDMPLSASFRPLEDLRAAVRLASLLRRRPFDVVHVHGFKASLPGRLGAALAGAPVVYTVHNFVFEAAGGARRRLYLACERLLAPFTTRYIAVSKALQRDLAASARVAPARIAVVYNSITPPTSPSAEELAAVRQEFGLDQETQVVLCVARLVREKGVDLLLQAAAALQEAERAGDRLPPFRVLVAGDGPEEASLKELTRSLGLESLVTFAGYRTDVGVLLGLASVVALPSRAEGLSLALLEALAAGRPLVAAKAGGMPEIVRDGETALLVPVEDPLALAAALRRLLTDRGLAARLADAARADGRRFTSETMLDETLAVYDQLRRRPAATKE
ncbi:MAG: glycosyltransferase [Chitinophagales bacterium]